MFSFLFCFKFLKSREKNEEEYVTDIIYGPPKLKTFTIWLFTEKVC